MGEAPSEFSRQVRSLRLAQGLTVRALAQLVGVSKVTIWKWEKGEAQPRVRMIGPLAKALHVTPAILHPSANGLQRDMVVPMLSADDPGPPEALTDVIAAAKQMIAEASGANLQNITISIEY